MFGHSTAREPLRSAAGSRAHDGTGRAALPHTPLCAGPPSVRTDLARALASGFLAGEWTQSGLVESGAGVLGRRPRWLGPLARQTLELYPRPPHDRPRELATLIASRPAAAKAGRTRPVVQPVAATHMVTNRWRLPVLDGLGDVADFFGRQRIGARLVRRSAAPSPHDRRRSAPALPGQPPSRPQRRDPCPRGAQAAAEGHPAAAARRDRVPDPTARRSPRVPARRLGAGLRSAACGPARRTATGPGGVLRQRHGLAGLRDLALGRLPRTRRPLPVRAGDQRPAALGLAGHPAALGRRAPGRPLAAGTPTRRAAPAAGCAHLSGAGQPRRVPARRPAHRARALVGRPVHALRRRPRVLRRRRLGHRHLEAARRHRGDRAGRGLPDSTRARPPSCPARGVSAWPAWSSTSGPGGSPTRSTCCAPSCTTADGTARAPRTGTRSPPSRITCAAGSPGSPSTTPCEAPAPGRARRHRLESLTPESAHLPQH